MGLIGALNSGLTGILANQRQVEITGNNIANVNSPGYSRQSAQLSPKAAIKIQGQLLGQGVNVQEVSRAHDKFVSGQIVEQNNVLGQESAKSGPLAELERVFGLGEDSLASDIERFFGAWHDLSQNPGGSVERDRVLYEGENLLDSFEQTEEDLVTIRQNIDETLSSKFTGINRKLQEFAELNQNIKSKETLGHVANTDRDRRDLLINELSKTLGVQTYRSGEGQIGAQLPGGIPLVQGNSAVDIESYYTGGELRFQVKTGGVTLQVNQENFGGEFKGLLGARDDFIPEIEQSVSGLKYSLITEVNARHEAGYGLDGQTGRAFFSRPASYRSDSGFADPEDLAFQQGTIQINGNPPVDIGKGDTSLNGMRDAINQADVGILASVVHDGSDYHLDLTPKVAGDTVTINNVDLSGSYYDSDFSSGFNINGDGNYQSDDTFSDPDALGFAKGTFSLTVEDGVNSQSTDVSIESGENSLEGVRQAINQADAGVNASIEAVGSKYALVLSPRNSWTSIDTNNLESFSDSGSLDFDDDGDGAYFESIAGADLKKVELTSTQQVAAAGATQGSPGDNENALAVYDLMNSQVVDGEKTF
ncbi:MAG: flagellar hook-associated protein FlgK, partial [Desulfohalobiaceae bacterium]|nr:flagellar hook-associated protein FlgK [Desulfohalobiaceae bacterium]